MVIMFSSNLKHGTYIVYNEILSPLILQVASGWQDGLALGN